MPIWSLTKERVEKLLKNIGDKEIEIDILIKLTKEDLWKRDLEDFINEWRFQLADEDKRQKKVANMGRRASKKLNFGAGGPAGRKRKAQGDSDDSDFEAPSKAKKPAKEVGGLLSYLNEPSNTKVAPKAKAKSAAAKAAQRTLDLIAPPKEEKVEDLWIQLDGASGSDAPKPAKAKAPAPFKKPAPAKGLIDSEDDVDEEIVRPTAGRQPRAAATKPVKYNAQSDSDSDGDGMLFDVGKMVKGIDTVSASVDNSRPLFSASMSRPGSSAGLPKKTTSAKQTIDIDADDTDYSKLAPPTTKKGPSVTARKTILSDDDDDSLDDMVAAPPAKAAMPKAQPKAASKAAPKPKAAVAKKPTPAPKIIPLSPAAKAYAAKRAKAEKASLEAEKKLLDDSEDEVEKVANEIMDEDDDAPAVRRPARRAAAAAPKKKWVVSDEEDEDEDEESEDDFEEDDSDG